MPLLRPLLPFLQSLGRVLVEDRPLHVRSHLRLGKKKSTQLIIPAQDDPIICKMMGTATGFFNGVMM